MSKHWFLRCSKSRITSVSSYNLYVPNFYQVLTIPVFILLLVAYTFGYERLEGEIVGEINSSQDGFHLRNTRS